MINLEQALDLDIHLASDYPGCKEITNRLFSEICRKRRISNKTRSKEALKLIILNLWVSAKAGLPLKYHRSHSAYTPHTRYGKLHLKYSKVIPTINDLLEMGLVEHAIGFLDREKGVGRISRVWPSEKLIRLFHQHELEDPGFLKRVDSKDIIQLKDSKKQLIDFQETRSVNDMRESLHSYNEFISQQDISISARPDELIDLRMLRKLQLYALKGMVSIKSLMILDDGKKESSNVAGCQDNNGNGSFFEQSMRPQRQDSVFVLGNFTTFSSQYSTNLFLPNIIIFFLPYTSYIHTYNPNTLFTNYISTITRTILGKSSWSQAYRLQIEKRTIQSFGLDGLDFQSHHNRLHRVFNNGTFSLGGRFYGAFHLEIPKDLRKCILINGEPTVEPDYSALHIRMLYHLEGIDYREDPYAPISGSKEERKVYKKIFLVSINAQNETKAILAARNDLIENQIPCDLKFASIKECLGRIKAAHAPIAKYLNTGIGLRLQNMDGRITELILKTLASEHIPALPVHDSFIVREKDKDLLIEVMRASYQQIMKFNPIIEWKGVRY
jgi:hypothetical protein